MPKPNKEVTLSDKMFKCRLTVRPFMPGEIRVPVLYDYHIRVEIVGQRQVLEYHGHVTRQMLPPMRGPLLRSPLWEALMRAVRVLDAQAARIAEMSQYCDQGRIDHVLHTEAV